MSNSSLSSKVVGFALIVLGLAACQAVAGIEDRKLDPNAGKPVYSEDCKDYCATVMEACTGDHKVYTTEENCLGVCALLDPGDSEDTHNNTLACRTYYANEALLENSYCPDAGPGGNGTCGSDCEAYCQLFSAACKDDVKYTKPEDCLKFCATLPDQPTFDVARDHDGDNIECRLVHVSSATLKPKEHCPHAPIAPSEPWCINLLPPKPLTPNCEDYCKITAAACSGPLAQYESDKQCMDVCGALEPGTNDDQKGNTVGCRRYHAFNASLGPENHCSHAGPTGDGHCGDAAPISADHQTSGNCESYCTLLAAACPSEFADEMGTPEDCVAACVALPEAGPDKKYSLANAEGSTGLHCRVLHAARAFEDSAACASALGAAPCAE